MLTSSKNVENNVVAELCHTIGNLLLEVIDLDFYKIPTMKSVLKVIKARFLCRKQLISPILQGYFFSVLFKNTYSQRRTYTQTAFA